MNRPGHDARGKRDEPPYCHHRLDINALSARHGLPYDPLPLPAAGAGSVYRQATVHRGVIATVLAVVAALLVGYVRRGRRP